MSLPAAFSADARSGYEPSTTRYSPSAVVITRPETPVAALRRASSDCARPSARNEATETPYVPFGAAGFTAAGFGVVFGTTGATTAGAVASGALVSVDGVVTLRCAVVAGLT